MSATIESAVIDSIVNANFKNLAEYPTLHFQNLMEDSRIINKQMNENLVRGSARLNGALDSLIVRGVKDIAEPSMDAAAAMVKMGTGVDPQSQGFLLAQSVAQLGAAVSGIQDLVKAAISTPPVTG